MTNDTKSAVATALDAGRAQGEIFAAIEASRKWPRDAERARAAILADLDDIANAKDCIYSFALGGSKIADGSIDLARLIAGHWGNMAHGFRIIAETAHERTVEGWCVDFERNHSAAQQVIFRKALQRKDAMSGVTEWVDTDDQAKLDLETKRYAAKCERNAIRECVPPILWRACYERARDRVAKGDTRTVTERKRDMLDACREFGITDVAIERKVGKPLAAFTNEDVDQMLGIYKAVAGGEINVLDVFDMSPMKAPEAVAKKAEIAADVAAGTQALRTEVAAKKAETVEAKRTDATVKELWATLWADYSAAKESCGADTDARGKLEAKWRAAMAALSIKKMDDIVSKEQITAIRARVWPSRTMIAANEGKPVVTPVADADEIPWS